MNDFLVYYGSEVKALGNGKVGGYLVSFGSPEQTDLVKDYFTAETDFDVDWNSEVKSTLYYNHGTDPVLGQHKLGGGVKATLKKDEVGVWIEAQLDMRNKYEAAIYGLAEQKKLGWSSGTAGYLVEREQVGESYHIKKWGLGLDASLTPTPAEPRNTAVELKSISAPPLKSMVEEPILGDEVDECLTIAAMDALFSRFMWRGLWSIIYSDILTKDQKIEQLSKGFDELSAKGKQVANALLSMSNDELAVQYQQAKSFYFEPSEKQTNTLQNHLKYVNAEVKELTDRLNIIKQVSKGEAKTLPFNRSNGEIMLSLSDELLSMGESLKKLLSTADERAVEKNNVPLAYAEFLELQTKLQ